MSWNSFLILFLIKCQCQSEIIFQNSESLETGDTCVSNINGVRKDGVCMPIQKCNSITLDVKSFVSRPTVCGYVNHTQIICCPNSEQIQDPQLDLYTNLDCNVANSNEKGVIKFLSECPELNSRNDIATHVNRLCTDAICSDLVCCPIRPSNRLKNVCWQVDHPIDTLKLRLLLNLECTVKELNITGRYQPKDTCEFLERNPNLVSMLKVCPYTICDDWCCCPIEDGDTFECTGIRIPRSIAKLVGPKCIDSKTGARGTCKETWLIDDISKVDECGKYCCENYYCIPDEDSQVKESISSRECKSYAKYESKEEVVVPMDLYPDQSSCSNVLPAGGVFAKPGEVPFMAALGYKPKQEVLWSCGGSLISSRFVLTAGHCLNDRNIGPVQKVLLGVVNLIVDDMIGDCPEEYDVARLIPHPKYNSRHIYNDIGLIELGEDARFNFNIRPLCLPSSGDLAIYYWSMGWGATGYSENSTSRLIKVNQHLFSYEECQSQYDVGRRYPDGILNETQICAGSRDSIQSTCSGDSGGPLVSYGSAKFRYFPIIQGVVSFGTSCGYANTPGVYTRVFPYVKWIEETVWKI